MQPPEALFKKYEKYISVKSIKWENILITNQITTNNPISNILQSDSYLSYCQKYHQIQTRFSRGTLKHKWFKI